MLEVMIKFFIGEYGSFCLVDTIRGEFGDCVYVPRRERERESEIGTMYTKRILSRSYSPLDVFSPLLATKIICG